MRHRSRVARWGGVVLGIVGAFLLSRDIKRPLLGRFLFVQWYRMDVRIIIIEHNEDIAMSTIYEVFHPESPGLRVFVRRNVMQQVMKLLSGSWMFANLKDKFLTVEEVDEYVSLIPVDSRTDTITDLALMQASPDERNPAYLLNNSLPTGQVITIFETLMISISIVQLRLLKTMVNDPSGKFLDTIKGFLIGLRLVNVINESAFLTLRFGIELHLDSFKKALDNVITRKSETN